MIKLSFCQNDPPMGESFWQKDSLITHILFELWLITLLWIVSVFLTQTLLTFDPKHQGNNEILILQAAMFCPGFNSFTVAQYWLVSAK